MVTTKLVKHDNLNNSDLLAVCNLKSLNWKFPMESQKRWITDNLKSDDFHFLFYSDSELVGYANLINVTNFRADETIRIVGLANVCTKEHGKGYGNLLMNSLNDYIVELNAAGLLFCKESLVKFYTKFFWQKFNLQSTLQGLDDVYSMSFNAPPSFKSLEYTDALF